MTGRLAWFLCCSKHPEIWFSVENQDRDHQICSALSVKDEVLEVIQMVKGNKDTVATVLFPCPPDIKFDDDFTAVSSPVLAFNGRLVTRNLAKWSSTDSTLPQGIRGAVPMEKRPKGTSWEQRHANTTVIRVTLDSRVCLAAS